MDILKIGVVPYMNAKPFIYGLQKKADKIDIVYGVPSVLPEMLEDNALDVISMPSVGYFRSTGYRIIPGSAIASNGLVESVKLFIKAPAIEKLVKSGTNIIQLRCRERLFDENPFIIDQISEICLKNNTRLILNTSPTNVLVRKAQGVHLSSVRLLQLNERPLGKNYIVGASCHNMNEIIHAGKLGLDFAVLSPVEKTSSHPGAIPMGWDKFEMIVDNAVIPVYALGGMKPVLLKKSWEHGAQGLAILSEIWQAENPVEIIRQCLVY